jgi:hypothetical protein
MLDPALGKSLEQLSAVAQAINETSANINRVISEFEKSLRTSNPGVSVWCSSFLRFNEFTQVGSQLGFGKNEDDEWGLLVRRASYGKTNGQWRLQTNRPVTILKLLEATRDERAAALEKFGLLVEELTHVAQEHLEMLRQSNRQAR